MDKAQVTGPVEQVKGRIKKVTGNMIRKKALEQKGRAEEIVGKAQASFGDLKGSDPSTGARRVMVTFECPSCHGRAHRIQRRLIDRLLSLIAPRHRYRCGSLGCGWEGNLSLTASSPPRRTDPVM